MDQQFESSFSKAVELFRSLRDKEGNALNMISFAADSAGHRLEHCFVDENTPADLRSVSKVVVCLTLGALIKSQTSIAGRAVSLDNHVEPLLSKHIPDGKKSEWRDVSLSHLLSNTIGHQSGFLFRKDLGNLPEDEYLEYVFSQPVKEKPGTHFSYSNVGPFLVSVILQDWIGKSLEELANEHVLRPLGIEATWRKFGDYTAGSTGLSMTNSNLIKIAALLRDLGEFEGVQIVESDWVREMSTSKIKTPSMFDPNRVFPKFSYGLGLWVCENGTYYCDGTNGQYAVVVAGKGLAMTTSGDQPDMKPITRCMTPLL